MFAFVLALSLVGTPKQCDCRTITQASIEADMVARDAQTDMQNPVLWLLGSCLHHGGTAEYCWQIYNQ
jgi:hypothetical protein